MEFGRVDLPGLNQIDFALPPDDPRTWICLKKARDEHKSASLRVGVGAPVWSAKSWLGKVYPIGTPPKDFLFHYARQFNSIELNTTHYRIPDEVTIERWYDSTPSGFKFNVKFLQEISHRRPLSAKQDLVREFVASVLQLEDRLGLAFLQLPPYFTMSELPDLAKFLEQLPKDFPLAIEVRHESFFNDHRLHPRFFDLLQKRDKHVVITDVAGRRDVLHTSLPGAKVLVRFIGNDLHPTDTTRMVEWVARIHTWINLGLEQLEFFVHQPEERATPEAIAQFIEQLNAECGLALTPPRQTNQGQQLNLL